MSTPIPAPGPSKKRKRPPTGNKDGSEGFGGPDSEDLEIASSSVPALHAHTQGQEFNPLPARKGYSGQCPNSAVADRAHESRKLAASTEAKSILYRIKESQNAYPSLKSIAEHLWHILDKCEVWPSSPQYNPQPLQLP